MTQLSEHRELSGGWVRGRVQKELSASICTARLPSPAAAKFAFGSLSLTALSRKRARELPPPLIPALAASLALALPHVRRQAAQFTFIRELGL